MTKIIGAQKLALGIRGQARGNQEASGSIAESKKPHGDGACRRGVMEYAVILRLAYTPRRIRREGSYSGVSLIEPRQGGIS